MTRLQHLKPCGRDTHLQWQVNRRRQLGGDGQFGVAQGRGMIEVRIFKMDQKESQLPSFGYFA